METRRDFLTRAALLGTALGVGVFPESIRKAFAIDPEKGTTYLDAEHVVILMQENRSFDHCFGTLQGVRGYNDPRAHIQPNRNPVWLQTNAAGETYAPFRLDMHETNATWMGSLPHSWGNQVDARNSGAYDRWLPSKRPGAAKYADMPLTLGHYTRDDIPFYYAFADAFTVCDQHFCSSLTGTTPNRLYLWSGTIREKPVPSSPAKVYNEEADFDHEISWTTFPERLEDLGIGWKTYQNEVTINTGFEGEEEPWLSNFGDNPIEYFTQFRVRFSQTHRAHLDKLVQTLPGEIAKLEEEAAKLPEAGDDRTKMAKRIADKKTQLAEATAGRERWSAENWARLSERERNLHKKAFDTNTGDPNYRTLKTLTYKDGDTERKVQVPKGDVLYQFRKDVQEGKLPAVSWLVGSERFSDHPSSPWYGAWYVSEVLDILTRNPEVWKKTILILTYDENDGYFDHVPPFTAPGPGKPETGLASPGVDIASEYIDLEQDRAARPRYRPRESSIGLGYRVPMVIASPWTRGGCVCSQVFDHTSVLQFLETLLTHNTGKDVREPNITSWRRTVCGDLTSAFQPYHGEKIGIPAFPSRDTFIEGIHKARYKGLPEIGKGLMADEIELARRSPAESPHLPKQEPGIRRSCPLPYELYADGGISADGRRFEIRLAAADKVFGRFSAGSPFNAYAYTSPGKLQARAYAVKAGGSLSDGWALDTFESGRYHVRVDGPNGFHREFQGQGAVAPVDIVVGYTRSGGSLSGWLDVRLTNRDTSRSRTLVIRDNAYGASESRIEIPAGGQANATMETGKSHGWYDFSIRETSGTEPVLDYRYAGRIETGEWSFSDPAMGRVRV